MTKWNWNDHRNKYLVYKLYLFESWDKNQNLKCSRFSRLKQWFGVVKGSSPSNIYHDKLTWTLIMAKECSTIIGLLNQFTITLHLRLSTLFCFIISNGCKRKRQIFHQIESSTPTIEASRPQVENWESHYINSIFKSLPVHQDNVGSESSLIHRLNVYTLIHSPGDRIDCLPRSTVKEAC